MKSAPLLERLEVKIEPEPNSGCHIWLGCTNQYGYGLVNVDGHSRLAHRIVYAVRRGEIPNGLPLDHKCRTRRCVNENHLEAVSLAENIRRGESVSARNARKTRCPRGHPYSSDNVAPWAKGRRVCLICKRERDRNDWPPVPKRHFCLRGHQLFGSNLRVRPDGRRSCRACRRKGSLLGRLARVIVLGSIGQLCRRCRRRRQADSYFYLNGYRYEWCARCWSRRDELIQRRRLARANPKIVEVG